MSKKIKDTLQDIEINLRATAAALIAAQELIKKVEQDKLEAQRRIATLEGAIRAARATLRSTQSNWREQELFETDYILTSALGEEPCTH